MSSQKDKAKEWKEKRLNTEEKKSKNNEEEKQTKEKHTREPMKSVKKVIEEAKEVLLKPIKRSTFSRDTSYRSASQTELLHKPDDSRGQYGQLLVPKHITHSSSTKDIGENPDLDGLKGDLKRLKDELDRAKPAKHSQNISPFKRNQAGKAEVGGVVC